MVGMYITKIPTKTKKGKISHLCILLRESYREQGKVKTRTIANLTHCNPKEVSAIELALQYKDDLTALKTVDDFVEVKEGMSVGAVWLVHELARRLGIEQALGKERAGKLALWQVIARVLDQGSRLSAVRLAGVHAACDVLGIRKGFSEDHLYRNLAWLSANQKKIEKVLFKTRYRRKKQPELFLYDVTSSYFEGVKNALADWGYDRDKKKGKKQVVLGLLCDEQGDPVSVEVYHGNTRDYHTFGSQVKKVADEFGCKRVTFVGDRGMIKSAQIAQLADHEFFHYITAITKPQINKLLTDGVFQMDLFEQELCEIIHDSIRYVLRRNPLRAQQIAQTRKEKKATIEKLCKKKNTYLAEHPRATVSVALKEVKDKIEQLKIDAWLNVEATERTLESQEDTEALEAAGKLDGCYVIKSDLPQEVNKQIIHDRYRDLAKVEKAFRTCKTTLLEMRPWHVHCEQSTRGHALVVMLSFLIIRHLEEAWSDYDLTVEEGLAQLGTLCSTQLLTKDGSSCHRIPTPRKISSKLLQAANVVLPSVLPSLGTPVGTRKKLPSERLSYRK